MIQVPLSLFFLRQCLPSALSLLFSKMRVYEMVCRSFFTNVMTPIVIKMKKDPSIIFFLSLFVVSLPFSSNFLRQLISSTSTSSPPNMFQFRSPFFTPFSSTPCPFPSSSSAETSYHFNGSSLSSLLFPPSP